MMDIASSFLPRVVDNFFEPEQVGPNLEEAESRTTGRRLSGADQSR
jgi:hypothetical protein